MHSARNFVCAFRVIERDACFDGQGGDAGVELIGAADDEIELLPSDFIKDVTPNRPLVAKGYMLGDDEQVDVAASRLVVGSRTKEDNTGFGILTGDSGQNSLCF